MNRRSFTKTQLNKKCGLRHSQDQDLDAWIEQENFASVCNMSEYADWDTVGQQQRLWNRYQIGQAPWDLVLYCNNSCIVELGELCDKIDSWADLVSESGQVYLALNKWCVRVSEVDPELSDLDFDTALLPYVEQRLRNFKIWKYLSQPGDRGGIGSWVHGNNRFWLKKHEEN